MHALCVGNHSTSRQDPASAEGEATFPVYAQMSDVTDSAFFSLVNQIPEFLRALACVSSLDACSVEPDDGTT